MADACNTSFCSGLRGVITVAPIYSAYVHGGLDIDRIIYDTVPENTYLIQTAEIGEIVHTTIDNLSWHLITYRILFANGITRVKTNEDTARVLRNIILYMPGDRYPRRNLSLTPAEQHLRDWGFFKHAIGDPVSYLTQAPYVHVSPILSALKQSFYTPGSEPDIKTNTDYINFSRRHNPYGPLIIFINTCASLYQPRLTPIQKVILRELQEFERTQIHKYVSLGLQFGTGYVHTNNAVEVSRTPTGAPRFRGAPLVGQSFARNNRRTNIVEPSRGLLSGNDPNNNTEVVQNRRGLCQKCMNYLGRMVCCGRTGGRRTRKSNRSRGKFKRSRRK